MILLSCRKHLAVQRLKVHPRIKTPYSGLDNRVVQQPTTPHKNMKMTDLPPPQTFLALLSLAKATFHRKQPFDHLVIRFVIPLSTLFPYILWELQSTIATNPISVLSHSS